jgi:PAS domain S-box-containing protein
MTDPSGQVVRLLIISRDVTNQKEAEERLQKKENFFRSLVENAHDLVSVMRYDATILYESPACERVLGFTAEEKLGRNCLEYLHADDRGRVTRELSELVTGKSDLKKLEYRYLHKSGSYVPLEVIARRSTDESGDPIVIVNKRDITERLRKEDQLRKLVARLLNVQDEERRRLARELHDETAQNLVLMDINFSTVENGVSDIPDDVRAAITQNRDLITRSLREVRTISYLLHPPMLDEAGLQTALSWLVRGFSQRSGIKVELNCPTGTERFSSEIEIAVYRIVQEALTNIHRHSGSPTAQVRLQRKGNSLILTVEDQGCGIPDTVLEKRAAGVESLGVGIPGMRERLHLLGGRLDVRSDTTGTSLMAALPLDRK